MEREYWADAQNSLIVIRPAGDFSAEKLQQILSFIDGTEESYENCFNRFTDTSRVTDISISFAEIFNRSKRIRREDCPDGVRIKHAIYAPNNLAYGIGKMHQTFSQLKHMEIRVFLDPYLAAEWLEVDPAALDL